MLATGYQLATTRPLSFHLLGMGVRPESFLAIPVLAFAAPFVIMRNTIRGRRMERRNFIATMISTVIAGFWSLMSGTFFLMTLRAAGLLA